MFLVDLRAHGDSDVQQPPHTVSAAAADVGKLASVTGAPVHAVLGHSFGGKAALQYAAREPDGLKQVWVIDSTPAPKEADGAAWRLLEVVRRHPGPFAARQEAIDALVHEGVPPPTAQWMATNIAWDDGRYRWRLDFDVMEQLLIDFFRTDLWRVVEAPPAGLMIHIVKANDSGLLTPAACARIGQAASAHRRVQLHRVEGGHWLNTDNPEALIDLLSIHLPRSSTRPRPANPTQARASE
jgi:pimeloyl-ACP methyl ester carboxylesterase